MALRVFTRKFSEDDFTNIPCTDLASVRNAIRDSLKDRQIVDCIAEDDSRTIMSERWFVVFLRPPIL